MTLSFSLAEEYHKRAHSAIKDAIVEAKEMDKISTQLDQSSSKRINTSKDGTETQDYENKDTIKAVITYLESSLNKDSASYLVHHNIKQSKEFIPKKVLSGSIKTFEIHNYRMNNFRKLH